MLSKSEGGVKAPFYNLARSLVHGEQGAYAWRQMAEGRVSVSTSLDRELIR